MESLVKTIAQKVDADDSGSTSSERSLKTAPINSDLATALSGLEHAPINSLFNNSIITGRQTSEEPEQQSYASEIKPGAKTSNDRIRQKLLAFVPIDKDIDIIFEEASAWTKIWMRYFPELELECSPSSIVEYTKTAIRSGPLLSLAKALLCITLSLQQIPASRVRGRLDLPIPAEELMYHYSSNIEKYIIGDDHHCGTLEGLECAVLLTKIDANAGRPRKAWLTHRRAMSFTLMMGLNRRARWQKTPTDQVTGPRRRAIFLALFQGDRFFSLLLGLPYSLTDQQCDIGQMAQESSECRPGLNMNHVIQLSNLSGRLIDRCQNPDLVSLASTTKLDQELEELSAGLPSLVRLDSQNASHTFEDYYDHNVMRFYHHYIRSILHLPFMLKSHLDRRYEYSRIAALDSAREMIYAYRGLRSGARSGFCVCKTIDFQVFVACITLALNIQSRKVTGAQSDPLMDQQDWQLISDVKKLLEIATSESALSSNVQDQAARTLGLFLSTKDADCSSASCGTCKVVVPYFGTITVTPRVEIIQAWRDKHARQQPTPSFSPSFPPSSVSTPSTLPWQLPTPPRGASSLSSTSDTASPRIPDPYIAFDPFNLPMPAGSDGGNGGMVPDAQAPGFYDPLLGNMSDWTGGYDWSNMAGGGMDLELDNDWNWVVSGTLQPQPPQQQQQQQQQQSMGVGAGVGVNL